MNALLQEDGLVVAGTEDTERYLVEFSLQTNADWVLHWGLSPRPGGPWQRPPEQCWPQGSTPADAAAVRSPISKRQGDQSAVAVPLTLPCPQRFLEFVIHFPGENRWMGHNGHNFSVRLPDGRPDVEQALVAWHPGQDVQRRVFTLSNGDRLAAAVRSTPEAISVRLASDAPAPLVLHWGLAMQFPQEWALPPESLRPAGTTAFDERSVDTPFTTREGLQYLELEFPAEEETGSPRGLQFVLRQPETNAWLNCDGKDLHLTLFKPAGDARLGSPLVTELAEQIVGAECGASSWTLMHRFNLCRELLAKAQDDEDGLALLYVWLRYSSIRQLDWQRNYNTKPRELSHAQDQLTERLAGVWRRHAAPEGAALRRWVRLLLTTLGRGGDGQRVRDEILHIMHRHHIKETSGHFIEEWHQKLHNNTTPDDVVICEAFLAFLGSDGNAETFYQTLEAGGVTRERLASFERPIKSEPKFYADKKDALIKEFEEFLRILKAVHAGTDLEVAAKAAHDRLDAGLNQQLEALLATPEQAPAASELANTITTAREKLRDALNAATDDAALRDFLFLDLALEQRFRMLVEKQDFSEADRDTLVTLIATALRGLLFSSDSAELKLCVEHWTKLSALPHKGPDWALHAKSVADRASRWLQEATGAIYQHLQPKAEYLGAAFKAQDWAVTLFSEEIVRGGPAFALSLLLRHLDPLLREAAGLGGWQVISPAKAAGRVRKVERLSTVQGERFAEATVLIADAVSGDEEIPEGVTAVVTADTPDLVSHVSVRARNAHLLFATCFDTEEYDRLKGLEGKSVSLRVTPGGDVEYQEGAAAVAVAHKPTQLASLSKPPQGSKQWVVTQDQFTAEVVGGKSRNLNGLRGKLPDWIRLPASLALPFGTFEKVLQDPANAELRGEYEQLIDLAQEEPQEALPRVRDLLNGLAPPAPLREALQATWKKSGLPATPWEQTWHGIQRVWASKWNERAFLSRRAHDIPHDHLLMAVLIQQVVPADYAYVLHTVNPLTGNRNEIFAEVVLGLGETLVGNYPGRALGFVCDKKELRPKLISYPGKSVGLYGKGVIFRSDSNGEDLEGFAGAGLYDSFLAEEPESRLLNYRDEKLVWDEKFRTELLRSVAKVGLEVERILGSAQDIEGAVAGGKFHVVQTRPQVGLESA